MSETMLAGVLHGAKDIRLNQVARPEPRPGMVLLRVRQAGICGSDLRFPWPNFRKRCGALLPRTAS